MKSKKITFKNLLATTALSALCLSTNAQTTNVFDDVIATSPNHTILTQAINTANLDDDLRTLNNITVFAPTDAAFTTLLGELNISATDLLNDPELEDILLYHVLGAEVLSTGLANGTYAPTLAGDSTFVSVLSSGAYIDQAMVTTPDLTSDNGVVHVVNDVILAQNSIVDVAVSGGFSILAQAVITAELAPALIDPISNLTVFAPTDAAFTSLLGDLGITANDLLSNPELDEILLYHVLGSEVMSTGLSNGTFATTLLGDSTFVSVLSSGAYIDQAMVATPDVDADNGVIHVMEEVLLPQNSIIDVAVSNGFGTLAQAIVTAELAPALLDPLAFLTVFAPTDAAFNDLATALNTDINGILALPNLDDVLLYHVVGDSLPANVLSNGSQTALNGEDLDIEVTSAVAINNAMVTTPDVYADNGIIHIVDAVITPTATYIDSEESIEVNAYPNPTSDFLNISTNNNSLTSIKIYDLQGKLKWSETLINNNQTIDVTQLAQGSYLLEVANGETSSFQTISIIK